MKRIARGAVGNHHDSRRRAIEKLPAVAGPPGGYAAAGRNLRLASRPGERSHINFHHARFVGLVSQPAPIRRKLRTIFVRRSIQEGHGLPSLPAGFLAALQGERHDVVARLRVHLHEGQHTTIWPPGAADQPVFALGQALRVRAAIGAHQVQAELASLILGCKDDLPAVRRPR